MKTMTLNDHQRGASVTSVVLLIIMLGLLGQLAFAIIPAYVGDYQLNQLIHQEIVRANEINASDKQFQEYLATQLSINADYHTKVSEVLVITNKKPGELVVQTQYEKESRLYGGTFIVNRFSAVIDSQGITKTDYVAKENKPKSSSH